MEIQNKLSEIGGRYLERTRGEMPLLRNQLQRLRAADVHALEEMEMLIHKIHGSGSMLGFNVLSELAGEMEALIVSHRREGGAKLEDLLPRLAVLLDKLDDDLQKAAEKRR